MLPIDGAELMLLPLSPKSELLGLTHIGEYGFEIRLVPRQDKIYYHSLMVVLLPQSSNSEVLGAS